MKKRVLVVDPDDPLLFFTDSALRHTLTKAAIDVETCSLQKGEIMRRCRKKEYCAVFMIFVFLTEKNSKLVRAIQEKHPEILLYVGSGDTNISKSHLENAKRKNTYYWRLPKYMNILAKHIIKNTCKDDEEFVFRILAGRMLTLGFPSDHKGFWYLCREVLEVRFSPELAGSMTGTLDVLTAEKSDTTPAAVEKAIRTYLAELAKKKFMYCGRPINDYRRRELIIQMTKELSLDRLELDKL